MSEQPRSTRNHHGLILRMEALVVLVGAVWVYFFSGGGWGFFLILFLVPDVFMLGYLKDPRLGAVVYNLGHTYVAPASVALWGIWAASAVGLQVAMIWTAHIALDRILGFGLKEFEGFKFTHLQRV